MSKRKRCTVEVSEEVDWLDKQRTDHIRNRAEILTNLQQIGAHSISTNNEFDHTNTDDSDATYFNGLQKEKEIHYPMLKDLTLELNTKIIQHVRTNSKYFSPLHESVFSPLAKCKTDLNFMQAIICLKNATSRMLEIPLTDYNLILNTIYTTNNESDKLKHVSKTQGFEMISKGINYYERQDSILDCPLTPQRWGASSSAKNNIIIAESDQECSQNSDMFQSTYQEYPVTPDLFTQEDDYSKKEESKNSEKRDSAYHTLNFEDDKQTNKSKEKISSEWLKFTLETLNTDDTVIQSIKIILSAFTDEKIIETYRKDKHWSNTLEKEAIDSILEFSNIYQKEKNSDLCIKQIVHSFQAILDNILNNKELDKVTSHTYQIPILMELCNAIPICVETIDFLLLQLENVYTNLVETIKEKSSGIHAIINKIHLILYALNINLRKYKTVANIDYKETKENQIWHVTDLWQRKWKANDISNEQRELQRKQKCWIHLLRTFSMACVKDFPLFAQKSQQLYHLLLA